ncbi:replication initiation and membrane attachment family protein [Salisediminibacterium selenitireducens]|uniref:Replication initiation and membrane attachment family protein n=1 Tax=Bacillus selenitireducens (strain ATCC 700615 / DSM 15326 / MLS10) TaxID=439292 RepID=D6XSU1_BACIE|nr:DnaD domain protein [Salisediminibacterium selenitireducens]ADH98877.1 replication initiation and membrane attachment family protein [[Bacillus] selenitireducens MLS10]
MEHLGKLNPSSPYQAFMRSRLASEDIEVMTLLYQPLIGSTAVSLYLTLAHDAQRSPGRIAERTHRGLMMLTGQPLDVLYGERKKLEGMGLLKVYKKTDDGEHYMIYKLQSPLTPHHFFHHDIFPVFLLNKTGEHIYKDLRHHFAVTPPDATGYEAETLRFDDVFRSVHPSELKVKSAESKRALSSTELLSTVTEAEESFGFSGLDFDYETMLDYLPQFTRMPAVESQLVQRENIRLIENLVFLYQLDAKQMAELIGKVLLNREEIDFVELRQMARETYQLKESRQPAGLGLTLTHKDAQPDSLKTVTGEPANEYEERVAYYENSSPLDQISDLTGGAKIFDGDLKIIDELIFDYALPPGVVNVLITYLFRENDERLVKNLAFKIANSWKRKGIRTVPQAMKQAVADAKQNESFKQHAKTKKTDFYKKPDRQVKSEPVPEWMENPDWNKEHATEDELDAARKEAAEKLARLKKKSRQKGDDR